MSVSARPRATTTAPITNTPSAQARYLIMTNRKKMAATQVSAVTNSYMLPHGARCTASPLVPTATVCATTPAALSAMAAWTHGPAWRIARSGGPGGTGGAAPPVRSETATSGIESGAVGPGAEGAAGPEGAAGAEEAGGTAGAAAAAPTEARAPARARACCPVAADAARRGRPKAKSPANATTESE